MASSLLNAPYPDTHINRYDLMARDILTPEDEARDKRALAYYLDLVAKGDTEAKLMLKTHPRWRLKRWWKRGVGEIL